MRKGWARGGEDRKRHSQLAWGVRTVLLGL